MIDWHYIVACQRGGVSNEPPWLRAATRRTPGTLQSVNRWTRPDTDEEPPSCGVSQRLHRILTTNSAQPSTCKKHRAYIKPDLSVYRQTDYSKFLKNYRPHHSGKKKVERIRRIPFHRVAALDAFGIEGGNPFRDCIDSLLIDLEGQFLLMINKVIKCNRENTPHLKGTLTIELNRLNIGFTFQQVLNIASL